MYLKHKLPELHAPTYSHDLAGLRAWLLTQPPETTYRFMSTMDCLICRFANACGLFDGGYLKAVERLGGALGTLAVLSNNNSGKTYREVIAAIDRLAP